MCRSLASGGIGCVIEDGGIREDATDGINSISRTKILMQNTHRCHPHIFPPVTVKGPVREVSHSSEAYAAKLASLVMLSSVELELTVQVRAVMGYHKIQYYSKVHP